MWKIKASCNYSALGQGQGLINLYLIRISLVIPDSLLSCVVCFFRTRKNCLFHRLGSSSTESGAQPGLLPLLRGHVPCAGRCRQPPAASETSAAASYPAVQHQICLKCAPVSLKDASSGCEEACLSVKLLLPGSLGQDTWRWAGRTVRTTTGPRPEAVRLRPWSRPRRPSPAREEGSGQSRMSGADHQGDCRHLEAEGPWRPLGHAPFQAHMRRPPRWWPERRWTWWQAPQRHHGHQGLGRGPGGQMVPGASPWRPHN